MNRILMAACAAVLVSSASLAFAASSTYPSNAALTTEHCGSLEQQVPYATPKSDAARQNAEESAMSLCRWDRHKNGGKEVGSSVHEDHAASTRG